MSRIAGVWERFHSASSSCTSQPKFVVVKLGSRQGCRRGCISWQSCQSPPSVESQGDGDDCEAGAAGVARSSSCSNNIGGGSSGGGSSAAGGALAAGASFPHFWIARRRGNRSTYLVVSFNLNDI